MAKKFQRSQKLVDMVSSTTILDAIHLMHAIHLYSVPVFKVCKLLHVSITLSQNACLA
jgi:hypothetical protein